MWKTESDPALHKRNVQCNPTDHPGASIPHTSSFHSAQTQAPDPHQTRKATGSAACLHRSEVPCIPAPAIHIPHWNRWWTFRFLLYYSQNIWSLSSSLCSLLCQSDVLPKIFSTSILYSSYAGIPAKSSCNASFTPI